MRNITTYSPRRIQEALEILAREREGVRIISGGTDVLVQILEGRRAPKALLDISRIGGLRHIREEDGMIQIGPLATHREIERSPLIKKRAPALAEASFIVGSPQIKNLATVGGNIANASPVGDTVPALMVFGAALMLRSSAGERQVPLDGFALGPGRSVMRPDELLVDISFPAPGRRDVSFYERLGQRRLLSIAKVGVAFKATAAGGRLSNVAVALGAVAPTVIMAPRTAACLEGKRFSAETARDAARMAEEESRAITDLRSTESYRNRMAGVLLLRGLERVMG